MILLKTEPLLGPTTKRRYVGRLAHQAQIQFIPIYRGLAGIALRKELQDDTVAKIRWQRNVRLQGDAFTRRRWKQIAKTRDGRIATIGADQRLRDKNRSSVCFNFPIRAVRPCCQCRYRCLFINSRAESPRPR